MSYTYSQLVAALVAETNIPSSNAGFVAILPTIIDQAEGMIYREPEFDFLSTVVSDDSGFTTAGQQQFNLPRYFTVLDAINLVDGNDRLPVIPISRQVMNYMWPSRIAASPTQAPVNWAPYDEASVLLGPTPGGTFQLECIGTARPANISASNTTTWLWTYLGDLGFAAAMYFMSGYMRNWSAMADDPKMSANWRDTYDRLKAGVAIEETKRKHADSGVAA